MIENLCCCNHPSKNNLILIGSVDNTGLGTPLEYLVEEVKNRSHSPAKTIQIKFKKTTPNVTSINHSIYTGGRIFISEKPDTVGYNNSSILNLDQPASDSFNSNQTFEPNSSFNRKYNECVLF